ncbi:hypothetical protein QQF64_018225 [Cirrhinus molitorella]|uniref:Uncharacterized protein n=1 Tax=Cirrhinus molitorella TaxID=172907 RepID=A0ABR3LKW5_9TELE
MFPFSQQGKWTGATLPGHVTQRPSHRNTTEGERAGEIQVSASRFNPFGVRWGATQSDARRSWRARGSACESVRGHMGRLWTGVMSLGFSRIRNL